MGELIQLDHMVININGISNRTIYAIDPITKLTVFFDYADANNASLFLKEKMLKLFPFKIKSVQVDGGSEFMKYFSTANYGHEFSNESELSFDNNRSLF